MKANISKSKQKYQAMKSGGMYSDTYLKDAKKKLIEELKAEYKNRIASLKADKNKQINFIKAKYQVKELSAEELNNYERQLRAMPTDKLKKITGEGLSKHQIYVLGAELRNRSPKLADHFMEMAEASNYFEPYANDFDYKRLKKDETVLIIMENNYRDYYDVEEDNLQNVKGIIRFDTILD